MTMFVFSSKMVTDTHRFKDGDTKVVLHVTISVFYCTNEFVFGGSIFHLLHAVRMLLHAACTEFAEVVDYIRAAESRRAVH